MVRIHDDDSVLQTTTGFERLKCSTEFFINELKLLAVQRLAQLLVLCQLYFTHPIRAGEGGKLNGLLSIRAQLRNNIEITIADSSIRNPWVLVTRTPFGISVRKTPQIL